MPNLDSGTSHHLHHHRTHISTSAIPTSRPGHAQTSLEGMSPFGYILIRFSNSVRERKGEVFFLSFRSRGGRELPHVRLTCWRLFQICFCERASGFDFVFPDRPTPEGRVSELCIFDQGHHITSLESNQRRKSYVKCFEGAETRSTQRVCESFRIPANGRVMHL
jgi:hypothetical protein